MECPICINNKLSVNNAITMVIIISKKIEFLIKYYYCKIDTCYSVLFQQIFELYLPK